MVISIPGVLLAAALSLHSADVSSSCVAFSRGLHETNPFVPTSCAAAAAETAAVDTGLVWFVERKIKTPWKRAAIYGALVGVSSFAVVHNLRQIHAAR